MLAPLLTTKFFPPPVHPDRISREDLIQTLQRGLHRKLTLISAPAGFGKSTLAGEWIEGCQRPAAWLSLDPSESDPIRFLRYFTAALQQIIEAFGKPVQTALSSAQPPPIDSILPALVNELACLENQVILVLDDYHRVESPEVDRILAFLVEHGPPQFHLVLVTREDPSLPLAKLRAGGKLTELRAADLRFSSGEISAFLKQMLGIALDPQQLERLEQRTEGWVAGLQMVALSLQDPAGAIDFLQELTGSHRFILDYLVEEVLKNQPEEVTRFLLRTSILDRFTAPLCSAVTGQQEAKSLLRHLEQNNLFLIPLDDERRWFRFHHLFADVLRSQLQQQMDPPQLTHLHREASWWLEQNNHIEEAIHHAHLSGNEDDLARLLERRLPLLRQYTPEAVYWKWLDALSQERILASPVLSTYCGFALLSGSLEQADQYLGKAEQWCEQLENRSLEALENEGMVLENKEELKLLPGILAIARAYYSGATNQFEGVVTHAEKALAILPREEIIWRGAATALLSLTYWSAGELEQAYCSMQEGLEQVQRGGDAPSTLAILYLMSSLRLTQGQLNDAFRLCRKALSFIQDSGLTGMQGHGDIHVVLAGIHYHRGDLHKAEDNLEQALTLGDHALLPESRHLWHLTRALILGAQGKLREAIDQLEEAETRQCGSPVPEIRPLAAWKCQILLTHGQPEEASRWSGATSLEYDDSLSYLREFEHVTLARLRLTQARESGSRESLQQTTVFLRRLLDAAQTAGRKISEIDIRLLLSQALEQAGETSQALAVLRPALSESERQGYFQVFNHASPELRKLLERAGQEAPFRQFFSHLKSLHFIENTTADDSSPLIEPLSRREKDVLVLLGSELSGPEIAGKLFISPNTLRTHTKNIYSKLGVGNRRSAVILAREMGLLEIQT